MIALIPVADMSTSHYMSERFPAESGQLPSLLVGVAAVRSSLESDLATFLYAGRRVGLAKVRHTWRDSWRSLGNVPYSVLDLLVAVSDATVAVCPYCMNAYVLSESAPLTNPLVAL